MILQNKIDIEASLKCVWLATIDVENWPLWSPAMEKIIREDSGDFKVGSTALIKQKLMPQIRWRVTELTPNQSFSWKAQVLGIHMVASHSLAPREGGVVSILKVEMTGWMTNLFGFLMKGPVRKALEDENLGLKNYCEAEVTGKNDEGKK